MRLKFIIIFSILPMILFSQIDSSKVYYKSIENEDLRTICDLTDIQIIKIVSYDTLLRNRVFNLIIKEFKEGKIISEDNLNLTSEEKRIPMVIKGDTMIYIMSMIDKAGFDKNADSFMITFAGQYKNDLFNLSIRFPGMGFKKELKGKTNYQLRKVNSCSDDFIKVPINKSFPILAYTPPFDTGSELQSYCLLGEEKVEDWFSKFKVNHYYVIYTQIK